MRRLAARFLVLALALFPTTPAMAEGPASVSSPLAAGARLGGAFAIVAVAMAVSLVAYRRFAQGPRGDRHGRARGRGWRAWWMSAAPAGSDRIDVLARSWVGSKESVCVVRVGDERFLVGVTPAQVSLLGRLSALPAVAESAEAEAASAVPDFARALTVAAVAASRPAPVPSAQPAAPAVTGASIREALQRSRARRTAGAPDGVRSGAPVA
jgi:flagellar protein FliO/FliZ